MAMGTRRKTGRAYAAAAGPASPGAPRSCPSADARSDVGQRLGDVADAHAARRGHVAPHAERDVVLAAKLGERLEHRRVRAAGLRVARGDDTALAERVDAQDGVADADVAADPPALLPPPRPRGRPPHPSRAPPPPAPRRS